MRIYQKLLILGILLLPIILGLFLSVSENKRDAGFSSGSLKKIGLVRVEGVIEQSYDYVRQLRSFRQDHTIAGVLLRIDSPGGAVAPSQEIYTEVMNYKYANKPLVVSMGTVAASGGYYIAAPAKKIFASPGTLTGSIGVIMQLPMFQGLAKKVGVEMRTFKSGKYKDVTSPYRDVTQQERALLQDLLDDTHYQFISDVAKARNLPFDTIKVVSDGRVFTGKQAVSAHLVDTLGGYEEAIAYTKKISGLSGKAKVIERREKSTLLREWLVEELAHVFPSAYQFSKPSSLQYLFTFE